MGRREGMLAGALLLLGLNSLYLAARADASLLYFGNVGLHVVLGLGAATALGRLVRRHWGALDAPWRYAAVVFALGAALGVALVFTGATRPFRALLYATCSSLPWAVCWLSPPASAAPCRFRPASCARAPPPPPCSPSPPRRYA